MHMNRKVCKNFEGGSNGLFCVTTLALSRHYEKSWELFIRINYFYAEN
jgi:hypothetical protein